MKLSIAFAALGSLLVPTVLAEQFYLFVASHETSWDGLSTPGQGRSETWQDEFITGVKLVDGQGEQLNVLSVDDFTPDTENAWMILMNGGKHIGCDFKKRWPEEKFNVGDITVIVDPKAADPCELTYELRTRESDGNAAILDPLRFEGGCKYLDICPFS